MAWCGCSKIAEAEAAVSVNEKKWLVMHMLGVVCTDGSIRMVVGLLGLTRLLLPSSL
jgi:hypothetical protein